LRDVIFRNVTEVVDVRDGRLSIEIGRSGGSTKITLNWVTIRRK
jgi:hypothetical protein